MKKITLILLLSLFTFSISSCDNNDAITTLSGTNWVKTTNTVRLFTFTSTTEYVYSEDGSTHPGTYTFNGTTGVMIETSSSFELEFKVNGDLLRG